MEASTSTPAADAGAGPSTSGQTAAPKPTVILVIGELWGNVLDVRVSGASAGAEPACTTQHTATHIVLPR